jgi:hypothetical protein
MPPRACPALSNKAISQIKKGGGQKPAPFLYLPAYERHKYQNPSSKQYKNKENIINWNLFGI